MNTEQLKAAVTSEQIDAFKTEFHRLDSSLRTYDDAIKAGLEAALSAQPEQQQPASHIDYQQQRGVHADIIDEAIQAYDQWYLDDDYDAQSAMDRIMKRMRERRDLYSDQKEQPPASAQAMTDAQINELGVEHGVVPEGYWSEDAIAFARALLSSNVQPSVNAEVHIGDLPPLPQPMQNYPERGEDTYTTNQMREYALAAIRSLIDQPVRGEVMLFKRVYCFIFGHEYEVHQTFSNKSRRVICKRCDGDWAMNDNVRAFVKWNGEFEELYKTLGHTIKPRIVKE